MTEWLPLALALVAGLLLGAFFFAGLWWTVRKGVSSKQPALWFFGSMMLRTGIILAGFYFVGCGHWKRLVTCLLGFVIARFIVTLRLRSGQARVTGSRVEHQSNQAMESGHAT